MRNIRHKIAPHFLDLAQLRDIVKQHNRSLHLRGIFAERNRADFYLPAFTRAARHPDRFALRFSRADCFQDKTVDRGVPD